MNTVIRNNYVNRADAEQIKGKIRETGRFRVIDKVNVTLNERRRTDRIVMRNPGTLRITPERIYNGDYTQARNTTIQKMLRMVGFGDNIGSGFQKIMKAWHSLGYPNPEIHEENEVNEVWLTLPLMIEDITNIPNIFEVNREDLNEGNTKGTEKGTENVSKGTENFSTLIPESVLSRLSELQQNILTLIWESPRITLQELSKSLNISIKSLRVQRKKLESIGILITRQGPQKNGVWVISDLSKLD